MSTIDLATLPPPDVVEPLDYETLFARHKSRLLELTPADQRAALAEVLELESEPITTVLQEIAYTELILRARINGAARANLIAFAAGADLDHAAAFYGVARLAAEADDRLRRRVQLQIAALAGNGTREQYVARALAADLAVVDAGVMRPVPGAVDLAVWIAAGADAADVLDAVRAAFAADAGHLVGVPVTVRQAQPRPIAVVATIHREAAAPSDLAQRLAASLPQAIADYGQLGRDVPRSWLLARLHVAGVSRVELAAPAADVAMAADEYAVAGAVTLSDGGIAW